MRRPGDSGQKSLTTNWLRPVLPPNKLLTPPTNEDENEGSTMLTGSVN